ncbi:hypothetical protein DVH24_034118 [Malus domestica]|uniref:UBL3-like ubiquitin domain-containing protein n=1 Tax=Malus domestica TaxID=3750 RepID=A0A498HLG2_MALDO|nr:hypothetical protein DVH24_034118 [Malus domestica]
MTLITALPSAFFKFGSQEGSNKDHGKTMMPKTANEMKLMSFGKILENKKTVGQCKLPLVDIGGGIIMMRVVGHPAMEKANTAHHAYGLKTRSGARALLLHKSIEMNYNLMIECRENAVESLFSLSNPTNRAGPPVHPHHQRSSALLKETLGRKGQMEMSGVIEDRKLKNNQCYKIQKVKTT